MTDMNKIIVGDSLEVMSGLPTGCVDIVVTSPPYNIGDMRSNHRWAQCRLVDGYDIHEDRLPADDYREWQQACITEMLRLCEPDGAVWYNHKHRITGKRLDTRLGLLPDGAPLRQIIVWDKHIQHNFNDWSFAARSEIVMLIAHDGFKLSRGASRHTDVWTLPVNTRRDTYGHPATFPVELPARCIESSLDCRRVLDPFIGSGTTAVAAVQAGVEWLGIEHSESYASHAASRIAATTPPLVFDDTIEQDGLPF